MKPEPRISKPFLLLETFSKVWEEHYVGETYEKSPRDFRDAKAYLDLNNGEFIPDTIISRAKMYLVKEGMYADNRHSFRAFINNIGSFVSGKRPVRRERVAITIRCLLCNQQIAEDLQSSHWEACSALRGIPTDPKIKEISEELAKKWKEE